MDEQDWQSWTTQEVEALLEEDLAQLSADDLASYTSVKVTPRPLAPSAASGDGKPTHWVVAERAGRVVYWDSVEEEFGVGRLKDGALTQSGNYGEIQWALEELFAQHVRRPPG